MQLNPQYAEAYYNRRELRLQLKENDEAMKDLATALRLKPGFPSAAITLAKVYAERGDANRAIDVLSAGLETSVEYHGASAELRRLER